MAIPNEFYLFREYSRAVKTYLQEKCFLTRYPKDKNVLVIYATPERAFSKYLYPIINSDQVQPIVSFHLSGIQYAQGENLLGFVKGYNYISSTLKTETYPPLLIYKLTYGITIRTIVMSDADILLYQILSTTSMNKKYWTMVDGQWMEMSSTEPRDETNLEPGEVQDRVIRYGMDLIIPRAYLPREYEERESIQEWEMEYQVGDVGDTLY